MLLGLNNTLLLFLPHPSSPATQQQFSYLVRLFISYLFNEIIIIGNGVGSFCSKSYSEGILRMVWETNVSLQECVLYSLLNHQKKFSNRI
jgi:hypothetical protein